MPDELDTIFSQAVAIPDPAARAAHLDGACAGKPALRRRLDQLVDAHFRAEADFLERPAGGATAAYDTVGFVLSPPAGGAPSEQVGPYKLLEVIGEGGMGTVWLADQQEPVRRRVAVKVIKAGMDSRAVLARFEAERQALALMDHPNIAKVLDAGATPDGRPYFAMELVKGVPITRYCDDARLPTAGRLALFADVCGAVQHAHQKGVIHRDLKPSNVLVGLYDGKPVVKVIDFGVAKAAGQPLTDRTLFTGFGAVVGTPEYMSPEQATFDNVDVDTRSDVYSLGVLLYELLTGTTPVTRERVREAALLEVLRVVREEDAPRPSTRISSTDARASIAAVRGTEPARLSRLLRGELDWVALRALEKDRGRRYESAAALADDVRRFLADEPVRAHPPSALYRLRKFARRNTAVLAAVMVVAGSLVAGTAVSVWQAVAADRARADAVAARGLADDRLRDEQRARADADREKARAGENYRRARAAVRQMLTRVGAEEVGRIPGMKEVRRKLLEDAAAFYTELLKVDPRDAEAYSERGAVYESLARFDEALADHEKAAELDPGCVQYHVAAGLLWTDKKGDRRRALAHFLRAVELDPADRRDRTWATTTAQLHYWVMRTYGYLGNQDECRRWLRSHAELAHPTGGTSWGIARAYQILGDRHAAVDHARRAAAEQPSVPWGQFVLAQMLADVGDQAGAMAASEESIRLITHPHDPVNANYYATRADLHLRAGRYREAEADFTRAFDLAPPGDWHHRKRRAVAYFHLGDYPRALADVATAVGLNPDDASTITWIGPEAIAACPDPAFRRGMIEQATRVVDLTKGSPDALTARATLHAAMGDDASARADWAAATAAYRRQLGGLDGRPGGDRDAVLRRLSGLHAQLGQYLLQSRRFEEAEPVLRECLAARETLLPDSWLRFNTQSMLGGALLGRGNHADAEPLLVAGYEGMKAREATIPAGLPRLAEAAERLVALYEATGRPREADAWRAKLPLPVAPPPRPRP